nr:MAG TPA: hypothetical protein [Bacteriophage sp.]
MNALCQIRSGLFWQKVLFLQLVIIPTIMEYLE